MESMDPIALYLTNYLKQHLGQLIHMKEAWLVCYFIQSPHMHLSYFEKHFWWL